MGLGEDDWLENWYAIQVMSVRESIEKSVRARRRGEPFTPAEFEKFGPPATVRRELQRLAKNGKIKAATENVFVKPRKHDCLALQIIRSTIAFVRRFWAVGALRARFP